MAMNKNQGLFPAEAEIARRLSQDPAEWRNTVIVLERHGFPKIDPIMGGRFWPAVYAYWHQKYGLGTGSVAQADGIENLEAL